MENKTVEITVIQSSKIVLIAKFIKKIPGGYLFRDEIKGNKEFALSNDDVAMMEVI